MAEFVFRAIGAALEALLDALIAHTGTRAILLTIEIESVRRGSDWPRCLGDHWNHADCFHHSSICEAVGPLLAISRRGHPPGCPLRAQKRP